MRYPLRRAVTKFGSVPYRALRAAYRSIDPAEREFRRVWPYIDKVEGFLVSPGQERWLFKAARSLRDGATIVEIGSFKGRSTCSLAFACRQTRKHVFAIDTFDGNSTDFPHREFFSTFWQNIERNGLTSNVTPLHGWSADIAKTWNIAIDFLFIDGSHVYEDVWSDFESFYPHVVPGGLIALHDVIPNWPGPFRVWQEVAPRLAARGRCSTLAFGRKRVLKTSAPQ